MTTSAQETPELSVVIACYMEESHLVDSVSQLVETLDALGRSYELIFIDDKSRDGTAALVETLVAGHPNRRAVFHDQNVGRGGTVKEGFLLARGEVVGFLDIDLEVHCRHLPKVLAAIDAGADGATAYRSYAPGWKPTLLLRKVVSHSYRWLFHALFDVPFRDTETGFKFFVRERIIDVVQRTEDPGWFWDSEVMILAHSAGLRIAEVDTTFERRTDKASTVRLIRDSFAYLRSIHAFRRRQRSARGRTSPAQPS
ncbi:MAG: glycosyltransferase [Planctomycetota bacterium]|nr:glycosyltransferase [Planctomycetota bacterium]